VELAGRPEPVGLAADIRFHGRDNVRGRNEELEGRENKRKGLRVRKRKGGRERGREREKGREREREGEGERERGICFQQ